MPRTPPGRTPSSSLPSASSTANAELDRLGIRFEAQEHKLLGGGGFEGSLKEVGELEKALGIHDLSKFTPGV